MVSLLGCFCLSSRFSVAVCYSFKQAFVGVFFSHFLKGERLGPVKVRAGI